MEARETVEAVYRTESRRVLATLIRLLGDFDRAEEAMHDAFIAAVERWRRNRKNPTKAGTKKPEPSRSGFTPISNLLNRR